MLVDLPLESLASPLNVILATQVISSYSSAAV